MEYLIILAVVLTIALVAVALIGGGGLGSGDIKMTESLTYWRAAAPIGIIQLAAGAGGNKSLIVNNGHEVVVVNSITLTQVPAGAVLTYSTPTSLSTGQRMVVVFQGTGTACPQNAIMDFEVSVSYTDSSGLGTKVQRGSRPITVRCY
jgi:hypothetical protein